MSSTPILGLGAALCWGTADFLGGLQSRHIRVMAVVFWSQIGGTAALLLLLPAFWERPPLEGMAWGGLAGLVGIAAINVFFRGLKVGLMSIVAPVSACGAVIPVVVAFLRGETPSAVATSGIALAVAGIVFVSRTADGAEGRPADAKAALLFALGAAVGFGTFFVLVDQGAAAAGSPLWVIAGVKVGGFLALSVALAGDLSLAAWPGPRGWVAIGIGVLDTGATALFAFGSGSANLGIMSVLAAQYPVVTVLFARFLLAERLSKLQMAGVVLALAGVTLMAAG